MNILVCVKQVPDTTEIKIDPVSNTLIRAGVPSIVNPFDACALEVAVRLKESNSGKVTVMSMGPEQAKDALKECLAVGADQAYLVSDRKFGGSDTLATSYILSSAVKKVEEEAGEKFDLIFCGMQAIDGDTGQVGPEIAEHLDYAQITCASDVTNEDGVLKAKRESDEGYDYITAELPAVITVVKTEFDPRYPNIKTKMSANRAVIPTLTSADMELDMEKCGLKGSPTKVRKTFTPVRENNGIKIKKETVQESVKELMDMLVSAKIM